MSTCIPASRHVSPWRPPPCRAAPQRDSAHLFGPGKPDARKWAFGSTQASTLRGATTHGSISQEEPTDRSEVFDGRDQAVEEHKTVRVKGKR